MDRAEQALVLAFNLLNDGNSAIHSADVLAPRGVFHELISRGWVRKLQRRGHKDRAYWTLTIGGRTAAKQIIEAHK